MTKLLEIVVDLVAQLSKDRIDGFARRIGSSPSVSLSALVADFPSTPTVKGALELLVEEAQKSDIHHSELAAMLSAASYAYSKAREEQSTELVWTGPTTEYVSPRRTEQVLLEVIQSAKEKLFIVSFVAYVIPSIMEALTSKIARNVEVSMLLELSEEHGGAVRGDSLGRMSAALPGVKLYLWKGRDTFQGGRVHAKIAVADEKICFVSSANLTGYAMDKNIEAGILLRGGGVPSTIHRHLNSLITTRIIDPV